MRLRKTIHLVEGQVVRGVVKNIAPFGLFIDLGEARIDGLCHFNETPIPEVARRLVPEQRVEVVVVAVDHEREKIAVTLLPDATKYPVGIQLSEFVAGPIHPWARNQVAAERCPCCEQQELEAIQYAGPDRYYQYIPLPDNALYFTGHGELITAGSPLWKCPVCQAAAGRVDQSNDVTKYNRYRARLRGAVAARDFLDEILPQALVDGARTIRWSHWVLFSMGGEEVLMTPFERHDGDLLLRFFESAKDTFSFEAHGMNFQCLARCDEGNGFRSFSIDIVEAVGQPVGVKRRERYPRCQSCRSPLATSKARQCFVCGFDWH